MTPCFQHDSYRRACSDCRDMNGDDLPPMTEVETVTPELSSEDIDRICDEAVKLADAQPGDSKSHWRAAYHGAMLTRLAMSAALPRYGEEMVERGAKAFLAVAKKHSRPNDCVPEFDALEAEDRERLFEAIGAVLDTIAVVEGK